MRWFRVGSLRRWLFLPVFLALVFAVLAVVVALTLVGKSSVEGAAPTYEVLTMQCGFSHLVFTVDASAGIDVTLPVASNSCAQSLADLLNAGLRLENSFNITDGTGAFVGPYFIFVDR